MQLTGSQAVSYTHLDVYKRQIWYQIFPDRFCNGDHSIDPDYVVPWRNRGKVKNEAVSYTHLFKQAVFNYGRSKEVI